MTDTLRGVLAMVASMLAFCLGDTLFKLYGASLPIGEMLFLRGLFASILVLAFCAATGVLSQVRRLANPLVGIRVALDSICSVMFFIALLAMTFADAAAIAQFTPLAVMAGAALFLGEVVGMRRWVSAGIGFLGVLFIIKPGSGAFQPVALIALASVVAVAGRDLITSRLKKDLPTSLLTAASALGGMAIGPMMAPFEAAWHWPSVGELAAMAVSAVTILGGYAFAIVAMRHGPTAITSPFRYSYMLFATLSSMLVFHERPDMWSLAGIALVTGAGLYMLHREQVVARQTSTASASDVACG